MVDVKQNDLSKDDYLILINPILKWPDSQLGGLLVEESLKEDSKGTPAKSTILKAPGAGFKRIGLIFLAFSLC